MTEKHLRRLLKLLDELDDTFKPVLEDEQIEAIYTVYEFVEDVLQKDEDDD